MSPENSKRYKRMEIPIPSLDEIQKTFRIELEPGTIVVEHVRDEISDKLFEFAEKILEPILSGSDAFCCAFEQNMLTNREMEELFELYRKIQVLKWENNLISIKGDEKEMAEWINKTWEFWNKEMESKLIALCKRFSEGWDSIKISENESAYHC